MENQYARFQSVETINMFKIKMNICLLIRYIFKKKKYQHSKKLA